MKSIILLLFFSTLFCFNANGQLTDDFSDGDLSNSPTWSGDLEDYAVVDGQCRLNASEAGTSFIYTPVNFPDSLLINLYFEINTNPSSGNFSRVYLALDNSDLNQASGLYLQLGTSGSDDAITLVALENGSATELASGSMGAISSRPDVNLSIVVQKDGFFSLSAGYDSSPVLVVDLETMVDFDWSTGQFFGLYNTYTSSNVGNYAFDNISIAPFLPDLSPPSLVEVNVINTKEIEVVFNEKIEATSISNSQFTFSPSLGSISVIQPILDNSVLLQLENEVQSGVEYTLTSTGIADLEGNLSSEESLTFSITAKAAPGDIVINEILFNPVGSGKDYVELISLSDKSIDLSGMVIFNSGNGRSAFITDEIVLKKDEIVAFTEGKTTVLNQFITRDADRIYENDLPDFNNSDGNVSILVDGILIDSFNYSEDFHFNLIDDVDGVSLERINPNGPSDTPDNWQSASSVVGFGTPGLPNSNLVNTNPGEDAFTLGKETFSPNLDGSDDNMVLQYDLDKPGYVVNIKVFDNRGFLTRELYNNELLGSQGTLFWNGQDDQGRIGNVGIYILYGDAFHPDGDRMTFKKQVVLADFLD